MLAVARAALALAAPLMAASPAFAASRDGDCDSYDFKGAGQGVCVKNNAASVRNRNLNATLKNNNASHKFLTGGGGSQSPTNDYDGRPRGFAQNN